MAAVGKKNCRKRLLKFWYDFQHEWYGRDYFGDSLFRLVDGTSAIFENLILEEPLEKKSERAMPYSRRKTNLTTRVTFVAKIRAVRAVAPYC